MNKQQAINYAIEKVKTFKDSLDGIQIWQMPNGLFDIVHTMNSNGKNHNIANGGKIVETIYKQ